MDNQNILLEVRGLKTSFFTDEGTVESVDKVDFSIQRGETFCIVGESGCGKSVTAFSIMQIVEKPGRIVEGEVIYHYGNGSTVDIAKLDLRSREIRSIRGEEIAMIFQEPMSSLSPVHTIGNQISEAIRLHSNKSRQEAREITIETLRLVGFPRPKERFDAYPFQLSGGMRQRAMIAMALTCRPRLLIADEPTTALDVTMQAIMLDLIKDLQNELGMAVVFITHNLGVVAEIADTVAVMYLGRIAEISDIKTLFADPKHPYTKALMRSIPIIGRTEREKLATIKGMIPHPFNRPKGCTFHPRCDQFMPGICDRAVPPLTHLDDGRVVRCFLYGGAESEQKADDTSVSSEG